MSASDLTLLFTSISWREPLWALLAFIPLVGLLLNISLQRKEHTYADKQLMPWVTYRQSAGFLGSFFSKNCAYILAWVLIGVALAGPRLPLDRTMQTASADIDIMLVVDVSRSMHATDIAPSRLRRAQIEIEEFLGRASEARVGVIVFAARPHLFVPLTSDHEALRYYLQSLDSFELPTNGSDPMAAVELAHNELSNTETPSAIIVLSDGDFPNIEQSVFSFVFTRSDIPVYALGIGSQEGGAIPLENGKWLQHEGRPVISRMNETNLQALLERTSGSDEKDISKPKIKNVPQNISQNILQTNYSPATDDDSDWQKLYDEGIAKFSITSAINPGNEGIWNELFFWPLSLALILLWISLVPFGFYVGRVFFEKPASLPSQADTIKNVVTSNVFVIAVIVACVAFYPYQVVLATDLVELEANTEINKLHAFNKYSSGDYLSALKLYKNITGFEARLGEGASYYKLDNYKGAVRQFSLASLATDNDSERAIALFNLGNAYFQEAEYALAATVYSDALLYNATQNNIQHNLDFSIALKKAVDDRLRTASPYSRIGSGPQLAPSNEAIENNQGGGLALDQNDSPLLTALPLPELADISDADLEILINKGLNKIRLAAQDTSPTKRLDYTRNKLSIINARLMMSALEDQQIVVWKRLFEMEEGFPASLTESRDIPGVLPW